MIDYLRPEVSVFQSTGAEHGRNLALALLRSTDDGMAERLLLRQTARVLLDDIEATVRALSHAGFVEELVLAFETGCRTACQAELLKRARTKPKPRRTQQAA